MLRKATVWWTGEESSRPNNCHIFLARYLRKLDQELHKFQLELEADNRGITEVQNNIETGGSDINLILFFLFVC